METLTHSAFAYERWSAPSWTELGRNTQNTCARAHAHPRTHTSATSYLGSPRALSQKVVLFDVFAHAHFSVLQQTDIHPTSQTCLSPLAPNPKESERPGKHYLYTKILTEIAESCRSDSIPVPETARFVVSSIATISKARSADEKS